MASKGHCQNILNPVYRYVGTGVSDNSISGYSTLAGHLDTGLRPAHGPARRVGQLGPGRGLPLQLARPLSVWRRSAGPVPLGHDTRLKRRTIEGGTNRRGPSLDEIVGDNHHDVTAISQRAPANRRARRRCPFPEPAVDVR